MRDAHAILEEADGHNRRAHAPFSTQILRGLMDFLVGETNGACEAIALHYLDDLDSKMGAMRATLEGVGGEGEWTERNLSLRRNLLRKDDFLSGGPAKKPAATSAIAPTAAPAAAVPVQGSFPVKK